MSKRLRHLWLFVAFVAMGLLGLHCYMLDGLTGWFFSLDVPNNTVYASAYTDAAFRKIKVGMTTNEVQTILGTPLCVYGEKDPTGKPWKYYEQIGELWQYSKAIEDLSFHVRNIVFKNGKVHEIVCEYYVD